MGKELTYDSATGEFRTVERKSEKDSKVMEMEGLAPVTAQNQEPQAPARAPRTYLGIAHGRITHRNRETGETDLYDNVTGLLTGIYERTAEFGGQEVSFYDFAIRSGSTDYVLSVNRDSSVARSLVNSLASVTDFSSPVVIKPWETDPDETGRKYTNVGVYLGCVAKENKMSWAVELPKVQYQTVGRNRVADDTERFRVLQGLVATINGRIQGK